jgi:SAM-dependent methyltransferase
MATTATAQAQQPGQIDLSALKTRQHGAWSSGDYAVVGTTLQIVGEELCEAMDLRAGHKVLDVAAGNGNATLAAARRWCDVVSTDYVPSLLERGRARAAAEGLAVQFKEADAEALDFGDATFDAVLSTFGVMFTPDQEPGPRGVRTSAGLQERRQDRSRQLDAGRLHRAIVQDARQIPAAAGRREIARAVGNAGAHHRDVRNVGSIGQSREASLHVPLPLADALSRRVQDLLRPDAESLCRA